MGVGSIPFLAREAVVLFIGDSALWVTARTALIIAFFINLDFRGPNPNLSSSLVKLLPVKNIVSRMASRIWILAC